AEDSTRWWWPSPRNYWPSQIPKSETIESFERLFFALGYQACDDSTSESGFQKIALYAGGGNVPTHAARQLVSGRWTSKLGREIDIEHDLIDLEGPAYGRVVRIFKKAIAIG